MTQSHALNLFSIPAGEPFLDRLAEGLIARFGFGGLSGIDVGMPNRRAVRGLVEAFLRASKGKILMLPAIRALGDVDEEDLILDMDPGFDDLDLPPAISAIERQLILTRMILAGDATGTDLAMAAQLAQALGHLIDEVVIQERSFDDLVNLVPARFADHWQKVLQFLSIVTQAWPAILAERGAIDAADRRGRLLKALTKRLGQRAPVRPMIIAGSTGSIPASAALMAQVARLENGMVILPGLDQDLDAPSFDQLEPGHPQWGMAQTLQRMGATRADVRWFGQTDGASKRAGLLSEALRPAATTELWRDARLRLNAVMTAAIDGLSIIIAPSEVEEASIIALALREALETPDKTAALVTPDRALARRVGAELARWRIKVDDSAGRPLSKTAIGIAFQLVLDVVQDFAPASILSLLKNPLCTLGQDRTSLTDAVARLEISALRGLRLKSGFAALIDAAEDGPARRLVERLADALAPLCALADQPALLGTWISAHCAALEHVSGASLDEGEIDVWQGDAGEALLALLAELGATQILAPISVTDYAALMRQMMEQTAVRPRGGTHPRLSILGPIEARLQRADLMILGGLNEETWPQASAIDPWFSRPMRADFGLDPPERRLGQSAHDFVMAASAPQVILTRAAKVGTTPSVPSRWLLRLETLIAGMGYRLSTPTPALDFAGFALALDRPAQVVAVPPPMPRPPLHSRPRKLSVTQVETLIRDPYATYARHILSLRPLRPIDQPLDAAIRGTLVHKILEEFSKRPTMAGDDLASQFLASAARLTEHILDRPALAALWWPRLERMAGWIAGQWPVFAELGSIVGIECQGELRFDAPGGEFILRATADRIDRRQGGLVIIDYKTGQPPSKKEIEKRWAAQLPLEAAIAMAGGFKGIPPQPIAGIEVIKLNGGHKPGERIEIEIDAEEMARSHLENFKALIAQYDHPAVPYLSRPRVQFISRVGDYDHLARVREWSAAGTEGAEP